MAPPSGYAQTVESIWGGASVGVQQVIADILKAVRAGDDMRLRHLIERFSRIADLDALFLLRQSLRQDLQHSAGAEHGGGMR